MKPCRLYLFDVTANDVRLVGCKATREASVACFDAQVPAGNGPASALERV